MVSLNQKELCFPCGSDGKESSSNAADLGLIPELGRSPGEGEGSPLQYSGLENSMDCIVHEVAKSRTRLSDCHREGQGIIRCCTVESMGSLRVGHN